LEYSGQVVAPDGKPASGAAVALVQWGSDGNSSDRFADETKGTTDCEGRFRVRMPKTHQLVIYVTPTYHAPFQRFWGVDLPDEHPNQWVPTNLGRLVLSSGIRLSGRLTDLTGQPIAGQFITADSAYSPHQRSARTDADGQFTFAPLRQGNYVIYGEGQRSGGGVDSGAPPIAAQRTVFKPAKVYLEEGIVPEPVLLREAPTIVVEARFVDSKGRPSRGNFVGLCGNIPDPNNQANQKESVFDGNGLTALINGPERKDTNTQLTWATQFVRDGAGRLVFRAPKGLQDAQLATLPPIETVSLRACLGEGKPLKNWDGEQFDVLNADLRGVSFVYYESPTIFARVQTEDGETPSLDVQVAATFYRDGCNFFAGFVEQSNGWYRSQNLPPDQEYEVFASTAGFVPNTVQRLRLHEGASIDLRLIVRRQPKPLAMSQFAPPFMVKGHDGQAISLDELRGKFVLIHFWNPSDPNCVQELTKLKAVTKRFGGDNRLVVIGLCLVSDPKDATEVIKEKHLSWSQVILRDRALDSIVVQYAAANVRTAVLVGPDGRVAATDLSGDNVEQAVARAFGRE
jgi:peroxiredoxin